MKFITYIIIIVIVSLVIEILVNKVLKFIGNVSDEDRKKKIRNREM